jgi:hypothetical protein
MKYPRIKKICSKHGEIDHVVEPSGRARCYKCRSEAVSNRRRRVRATLVNERGAKCERCGYNKCPDALDFHHTDDNKEFGISSRGLTRSLDAARNEANKCILICANCHREIHSALPSK